MDFASFLRQLLIVCESCTNGGDEDTTKYFCREFERVVSTFLANDGGNFSIRLQTLQAVLNAYKETRPFFDYVSAVDSLSTYLVLECAETMLGLPWHNMPDETPEKAELIHMIHSMEDLSIAFRDLHKFAILKDLIDGPWSNLTLVMLMTDDKRLVIDQGTDYIKEHNPDVMKLRLKILVREHCSKYAINLSGWCLRNQIYAQDYTIREMQLKLLYEEDIELFHCESWNVSCHMGLKIVHSLMKDKEDPAMCLHFAQTFLVQDWLRPKLYCCTKELLHAWVPLQYKLSENEAKFMQDISKVVEKSVNTMQIMYLVDVMCKEFGDKFLQFNTELCLLALKIETGHVERAYATNDCHGLDNAANALTFTCHIMSCLYRDSNLKMRQVCSLTALSLDPSEDLYFLVEALFNIVEDTDNLDLANKQVVNNSINAFKQFLSKHEDNDQHGDVKEQKNADNSDKSSDVSIHQSEESADHKADNTPNDKSDDLHRGKSPKDNEHRKEKHAQAIPNRTDMNNNKGKKKGKGEEENNSKKEFSRSFESVFKKFAGVTDTKVPEEKKTDPEPKSSVQPESSVPKNGQVGGGFMKNFHEFIRQNTARKQSCWLSKTKESDLSKSYLKTPSSMGATPPESDEDIQGEYHIVVKGINPETISEILRILASIRAKTLDPSLPWEKLKHRILRHLWVNGYHFDVHKNDFFSGTSAVVQVKPISQSVLDSITETELQSESNSPVKSSSPIRVSSPEKGNYSSRNNSPIKLNSPMKGNSPIKFNKLQNHSVQQSKESSSPGRRPKFKGIKQKTSQSEIESITEKSQHQDNVDKRPSIIHDSPVRNCFDALKNIDFTSAYEHHLTESHPNANILNDKDSSRDGQPPSPSQSPPLLSPFDNSTEGDHSYSIRQKSNGSTESQSFKNTMNDSVKRIKISPRRQTCPVFCNDDDEVALSKIQTAIRINKMEAKLITKHAIENKSSTGSSTSQSDDDNLEWNAQVTTVAPLKPPSANKGESDSSLELDDLQEQPVKRNHNSNYKLRENKKKRSYAEIDRADLVDLDIHVESN
ncbi:unnamed protein product [Owenia fusiformis]|uniref:Zinc finger protein Rlf/292/654 TPR repeats domain-containing protein n=1 Tax=Owenia fusiformis TaxID=6347 RepID=A0A8S4N050_OWEFU|nr:unnamed protein product [Owenia fusiformis]